MKPILFNTEMVRAIIEGRKTATRRLIKGLPADAAFEGWLLDSTAQEDTKDIGKVAFKTKEPTEKCGCIFVKPLYQPGDILYVRETFADTWTPGDDTGYVYKADGQPNSFPYWGNASTCKDEVWRPSLHMPKEAARLFLQVKGARVERLQDINSHNHHDDVLKEGIKGYTKDGELYKYCVNDDAWMEFHGKYKKKFRFKGTYWQDMPRTPIEAFRYLWNSTIKKYDYGSFWESNPWVWVIEFERISKEEAYESK